MKKRWYVSLLIGSLLIVLSLGGFLFKEKETKMRKEATYWVLSDNHYIDKSLYDKESEFQRIQATAAGKELLYQKESLKALVDEAIQKKPKGIIMTGDVTLNGERKSAEQLAKLLKPLEDNGIECWVIPGNHDINDGWARSFQGDKAYKTEQISQKDFERLFDMSYQKAKDRDPHSLSYLIDASDNTQFLLLDTAIYGKANGTTNPQTKGRLKEETLAWMTTHLDQAKKEGKETLVFMHHNLLQHNPLIYEGFVLENSQELETLLTNYSVPLVFSGHTHAQSIKKSEASGLVEVVSSSFSITEQSYGEIRISPENISYKKKSLNVDEWAKNNGLIDDNLLNYQAYTKKLFVEDGQKMAYGQLIESGIYDESILDPIAYFVGEMNWRYFTGNTPKSLAEEESLKKEEGYQLLKEYSPRLLEYVDSIIQFDSDKLTIDIPLND